MFTLRRFVAPRCASFIPTTTTTTTFVATTSPLLFSSLVNQSSNNNNNRGNNNNNNFNRNNNNNRNNNGSSSNNNNSGVASSSLPTTPSRISAYTKNGEAFCDISSPADSQSNGYRLVVAFPTTNCNFMDIQYAPQVRDKTPNHGLPAVGETPDNLKAAEDANNKQVSNAYKTRIFGMPIVSLTVRLYPLQMAKVVSVLEGKSSEAVIASRLAVGTFKRNANGSISYAIQTRVPKPEENQPTSVEVTISAVEAFMLEKFFGKMLVMGFDASRDQTTATAGRR